MTSGPTDEWREQAMAPLREWLTDHRARCLWSIDVQNVGTMSCYHVNRGVFCIMYYKDGGWDAYTQIPSQDIEGTLHDLAAACEL